MRFRYPALSLFTLAVCLSAQAGNRMLETPEQFATGSNGMVGAMSLFASDFTRDGKQDVLASSDTAASLIPGRGNGSFDVGRPFTTPGRVEGVADFDRDGNPDLFTLDQSGDIAPWAVMLGTAGGTFAAPVDGPGSSQASALVSGDFNNDTFPDLAAYVPSEAALLFYAGNGSGGFAAGQSFGVVLSGSFRDLAAGDFDGDGKLDLFLVTDEASVVAWNGGGTFYVQTALAVAGRAAAAGDVNGDGRADALALTLTSLAQPCIASVALGSSARGFTISQFRTEAGSVGTIAAVQLNGAGGSEVVVGMRDLSIRSYASGAFSARRSFASGANVNSIAAADFDADGKTDLVTPGSILLAAGGLVTPFSLLRGNGDGTLAADPSFEFGVDLDEFYGGVFDVSDINGDGRPDALIRTDYPSQLGVAFGTAAGDFAAPVMTALPDAVIFWQLHKAGEVNGDGRADVLFARYDESKPAAFQTFFAQQNGTYVAGPMTTSSVGTTTPLLVADFSGDGRADVIDSGGRLSVMSATGAFAAPVQTALQFTFWSASADMNNDGRRDVIAGRLTSNSLPTGPAIYLNNGNGTFAAPIDGVAPINGRAFFDLTGDGFPEAIAGTSGVFRNLGNNTFEDQPFLVPWFDLYAEAVRVADFDGDGKQDLAMMQTVSYGNGDGTFDDAARMTVPGEIVSVADFDGNGSPDLWISDATTMRLVIVRTRKQTIGTAAVTVTAEATGNSTNRNPIVAGQVTRLDAGMLAGSVVIRANGSPRALSFVGPPGAYSLNAFVPIGTSTITATYSGDRQHAAGEASTTYTAAKRELPFTVGSPHATVVGDTVTICVSVVRQYPPPSGNVTIRKGATVLGTAPAIVSDSGCPSSLALAYNATLFPAGQTEITADFPGDDNYLPTQVTGLVFVTKPLPTLTLTVSPSPLYEGQQATITGTFTGLANNTAVTGSLTFTWQDRTATIPITNNKAVWSVQLPWGNDYVQASYPGDATYSTAFAGVSLPVYRGGMTATPAIRATVISSTVAIAISPIQGATSYDLYRGVDDQPFAYFRTVFDTFTYESRVQNAATVYAVVARGPGGTSSPMSARDLVLGMDFSDDPLTGAPLKMKKIHITQLQTAVNLVRRVAHVPEIVFPVPSAIVSASHLTALRSAITEARTALGLSTTFTDPTITPRSTRIRSVHIQELREAMQ
jgi:hypothetical protein